MVGNEEGKRHRRCYMSSVCFWPECRSLIKEGVGIFECSLAALESEPRADDADAKDQTAAEAAAEAGFHDAFGSRPLSLGCAQNPPPSQVFYHRLVHGEPPKRNHGPEVVDGES